MNARPHTPSSSYWFGTDAFGRDVFSCTMRGAHIASGRRGRSRSGHALRGNIMAEGRGFIHKAMWVIFFPGLVLAVTVTSINLAGDGLRDILDPKLAHRM